MLLTSGIQTLLHELHVGVVVKIDLVADFLGSKKINLTFFASGLVKKLFGQFSSVATAIVCTSNLDTAFADSEELREAFF